jgi:hypothetical protein
MELRVRVAKVPPELQTFGKRDPAVDRLSAREAVVAALAEEVAASDSEARAVSVRVRAAGLA